MEIINTMVAAATSALVLWLLYNTIKHRSDLFTPKKLNESFFTMGILFIILIAIIGFVAVVLSR